MFKSIKHSPSYFESNSRLKEFSYMKAYSRLKEFSHIKACYQVQAN